MFYACSSIKVSGSFSEERPSKAKDSRSILYLTVVLGVCSEYMPDGDHHHNHVKVLTLFIVEQCCFLESTSLSTGARHVVANSTPVGV